jgi:hypothetical protein
VPPHNIEAEQSLIGAALISNLGVDAIGTIKAGDFYKPQHQFIASAIIRLVAAGVPVDIVTVGEQLRQDGTLADAGGLSYLAELQNATPAVSTSPHYARTVHDTATLRRILFASTEIADVAYNVTDPADALARAQRAIEGLSNNNGDRNHEPTSWAPSDLTKFIDEPAPEPELGVPRTDGIRHLYQGKIHLKFGGSESGKSWLTLGDIADTLNMGGCAIYIDFEDDERGCVERLRALGIRADVITNPERFRYIQPEEPLIARDNRGNETGAVTRAYIDFATYILDFNPDLVVIDALGEAMQREGLDPLAGSEVVTYIQSIIKPITRRTGATVVIIDHTAHEGRDRDSFGSVYKRNAIHASFRIEPVSILTRPKGAEPVHASSRIWIAKDRPGGIRPHAWHEGGDKYLFGTVRFTAWPDGGVTYRIEAPDAVAGSEVDTKLVVAVLDYITTFQGAAQGAIAEGIERRKKDVAAAGKWAQEQGYVDIAKVGNAQQHTITEAGKAWLREQREGAER